MAISFSESVKVQKNTVPAQEYITQKLSSYATPVLDHSVEEGWTRSDKYLWYNEYSDEHYSYIDADKNISVEPSQINLSQESNSQFIPFEIPRYYDGIDLTDKIIQVHYVNADGDEDYDNVVNVYYNNERIHFAWLIDTGVTYLPGEIQFEIRATGTNEKGDDYCWLSRPNGKLNIIASLSGKGIIKPEPDWYTGFINLMDTKISAANEAVEDARHAATDAQSIAKNLENDIMQLLTWQTI